MTLIEFLEINEKWLSPRNAAGIRYFEGRWVEWGRPTEPAEVERFLDQTISFCKETGLRYEGVMLKKLKQMQRGEWSPGMKATP